MHHTITVGLESIGRNLKVMVCGSACNFLCEREGIAVCSSPQMPAYDKLRMTFERDETVSIASSRIGLFLCLFLALNECPQLVKLEVPNRNTLDSLFEKVGRISTFVRPLHAKGDDQLNWRWWMFARFRASKSCGLPSGRTPLGVRATRQSTRACCVSEQTDF